MMFISKEDCVSLPTDAYSMTFFVFFLAACKWLLAFGSLYF